MLAALASAYVANSTWDAPVAGFVRYGNQPDTSASKPLNVPTWHHAYAHRFPGCAKAMPAGQIPATVLEVRQDATVVRVTFDDAWTRTHDANPANNGWIVGACK